MFLSIFIDVSIIFRSIKRHIFKALLYDYFCFEPLVNENVKYYQRI